MPRTGLGAFEGFEEAVVVEGRGAAGKDLIRSFSRERVLPWKRAPDCVYPISRH